VTRPVGVAVGRLLGDDDLPDIIVTDSGTHSAEVIQQNPAQPRAFLAPVNFTGLTQSAFNFYGVAVGDFTGDGKDDVAIATQLSSDGVVQTNDFDKTTGVTWNTTQWWDGGNSPRHVAFADINGDGALDCDRGGLQRELHQQRRRVRPLPERLQPAPAGQPHLPRSDASRLGHRLGGRGGISTATASTTSSPPTRATTRSRCSCKTCRLTRRSSWPPPWSAPAPAPARGGGARLQRRRAPRPGGLEPRRR
jgi:hypothetical protein